MALSDILAPFPSGKSIAHTHKNGSKRFPTMYLGALTIVVYTILENLVKLKGWKKGRILSGPVRSGSAQIGEFILRLEDITLL